MYTCEIKEDLPEPQIQLQHWESEYWWTNAAVNNEYSKM